MKWTKIKGLFLSDITKRVSMKCKFFIDAFRKIIILKNCINICEKRNFIPQLCVIIYEILTKNLCKKTMLACEKGWIDRFGTAGYAARSCTNTAQGGLEYMEE